MEKDIKSLLRCLILACKGKTEKYRLKGNINSMIEIARINRVDNILYYGLNIFDDESLSLVANEEKNKLKEKCIKYGILSINQNFVFNNILNIFKNNQIDFVSIKGNEIKKIYYKEDMRVMGDIDLVVDQRDYERAKSLLLQNGYIKYYEDNDELCIKSQNNIMIEIHRNLATESSKNQKYFISNYKNHLVSKDGYFVLDYCFDFIYMIDHIYKHYKSGGISIKYLLDFCLFIEKHPDVIEKTILDLVRLGLDRIVYSFLVICNEYLDCDVGKYIELFNLNISKQAIESLLDLMVKYGEYGTETSRAIAQEIKGTFWKTIIRRLFPNIVMLYGSRKNVIIKIILYPFAIIINWIKILFKKTRRAFFVLKRHKKLKNEDLSILIDMYNEI